MSLWPGDSRRCHNGYRNPQECGCAACAHVRPEWLEGLLEAMAERESAERWRAGAGKPLTPEEANALRAKPRCQNGIHRTRACPTCGDPLAPAATGTAP